MDGSGQFALCLGQFLEGTGSLKGLELGRDVVQHILERLAHSSDSEKSSERVDLGQDVGSTVQSARGTGTSM